MIDSGASQFGGWRSQPIDGAVLMFNHISGTNVLWRGKGTASCRRRAPRVLQVALTHKCTRTCTYCYQERTDACLDYDFLLGLLIDASRWGVLEIAFGGGEPLLFPRLVELLQELRRHTHLGLNLTTNGDLLTEDLAAQLTRVCGQIRVSVHDGARWRQALRLLDGVETGANILVTPANLGNIELLVRDAISLGAADVLLLGYKGPSVGLHLSEGELKRLEQSILRMQHLPLRLDACWYPLLPKVPQLLKRPTCGAADEILAITPDRKVKACSFQLDGMHVGSIDDLKAAFTNLRSRNTGVVLDGCMRGRFAAALSDSSDDEDQMWVWHARASNNSGDCTIVGRFQEIARAQDAAKALRELSRAHEAFLASPEGRKWYEQNDYRPQPTPPLQLFAQIHGFDWSDPDDALCWEEDGAGAPVLTAGTVGHSVVIYHPYCCGFSEKPFREFFSGCGAREFGHFWYDRPAVIVHAEGTNTAAIDEIQQHFKLVQMAKYPSEVADPPPWGKQCTDDRLASDEDRSAIVASAEVLLQAGGSTLTLGLKFENTYAGAIALENWLRSKGFTNLSIEIDDVLSSLAETCE
jgi:MoaA/NifB/PqqE/SkfB family radical SAM enzyme